MPEARDPVPEVGLLGDAFGLFLLLLVREGKKGEGGRLVHADIFIIDFFGQAGAVCLTFMLFHPVASAFKLPFLPTLLFLLKSSYPSPPSKFYFLLSSRNNSRMAGRIGNLTHMFPLQLSSSPVPPFLLLLRLSLKLDVFF